jgi:hypothetical protein
MSICLRLLKHDIIITYQTIGFAKYMCHVGHEPYQNTQNADYSVTYDCRDVLQL